MRQNPLVYAGFSAALLSAAVTVQADEVQQVMYGFDRESGQLVRHVLGTSESVSLGVVTDRSGRQLRGIDGAAYVPGFQNIFAFWTDPASQGGRLAYVDVHDATATLMDEPVEGGRVTGAVAVQEGVNHWGVYAVQLAEVTPSKPISGVIRLNPNNSPNMQFDLVEIDSNGNLVRHWTRNDLLNARRGDVDGQGTLIRGSASSFRIRPIGQGGQRDIQLGDETITLRNSNTYTFTSSEHSPMQVRVYNAQGGGNGNGSLPMGHWYLAIEGGQAYQGEEAEVVTPRRLIRVAHKDEVEVNEVTGETFNVPAGTVTELFTLGRDYDGLASLDGETFYATSENRLYRISKSSQSESLVATLPLANVYGLEFIADQLMGFEVNNNRFGTFNFATKQFDGLRSVAGMRKFGAIIFCAHDQDPNALRENAFVAFD